MKESSELRQRTVTIVPASTARREVLFLSYYFPPIGGPGVYRSLKFCKYLPGCGWQPTVIAGHRKDPDFAPDETLLNQIPPEAEVHRLDFPWHTPWRRLRAWLFAHRLGRVGNHLGFFFDFPCRFREWTRTAMERAVQLVEKQRPEVIYTTAPPFSGHWIGLMLKRQYGIPWVADFRDPWVANPIFMQGMPSWMLPRHARAELQVLREADHILAVADFMKDDFVQRCGVPAAKVTTIPNGFDPADFPVPTPAPLVNGRVQLVNTGTYYGTYSPQPLKDALLLAAKTNPALLKDLELVFVGGTNVAFDDLPGLLCRVIPRVSHHEAVAWQQKAHVLILVWGRNAGIKMCGKIFEYLAAQRPVLAVVPQDGPAAQIIRNTGAGLVASPDDPAAVVAALQTCVMIARGEQPALPRNEDAINRFSRKQLTEQLANILERVAPPTA